MIYYAAPMEGITNYIWRNAHHRYYPGIDKYFTPFLTLGKGKGWKAREKSEVYPENNKGICVVPQILTNNVEDFVLMAERIRDLGYDEMNLNLGCPSGTVVSKGKGSGFLRDRERLERFFDHIFSGSYDSVLPARISVKTRLGVEDEQETLPLMEMFGRFPFSEVIIHARLQKDMYKGPVRMEAYARAYNVLTAAGKTVCYNGDIFTAGDAGAYAEKFPRAKMLMLGRGLIANPQLHEMMKEGTGKDIGRLRRFHDELCQGYQAVMSGDRNVLFKMKEWWNYTLMDYPGSEKTGKKIRKSVHLNEYRTIVDEWFCRMEEQDGFHQEQV